MNCKITVKQLIKDFSLERHIEGGWFSECYTSSDASGLIQNDRPLTGSIYFLLDKDDISHFHQIDCEELWYYHAGIGLILHIITKDGKYCSRLLGIDGTKGQNPVIVIPKDAIFAAENIDKQSFTFVSCVTIPKFRYSGFRLVAFEELSKHNLPATLFVH